MVQIESIADHLEFVDRIAQTRCYICHHCYTGIRDESWDSLLEGSYFNQWWELVSAYTTLEAEVPKYYQY